MTNTKAVKINFSVQPGDDGYPPVAVESLWAKAVVDGYLIDSIPFFTSDATNGDRVSARIGEGDALWFDAVVQRSGDSLIRVVFFDLDSEDAIVSHLAGLGCGTERMTEFKLVAVDIPLNVSLLSVQTYLRAQVDSGLIDYENPSSGNELLARRCGGHDHPPPRHAQGAVTSLSP